MNDRIDSFLLDPMNNFFGVRKKRLDSRKLTHYARQNTATKDSEMTHISCDDGCFKRSLAHQLGQRFPVFTSGRKRVRPGYPDRQLDAKMNFPTESEPIHIRGLETVFVQKKPARPYHRGRAIVLAPDPLVLQFPRMAYPVLMAKDISLSRTTFKKTGNAEKRKPCSLVRR